MNESDFSDEQIQERVAEFEWEGFQSGDLVWFAEYWAKNCRGEVAEGAIRTLVEKFDDDQLPELVRKHVAPILSPGVDYCYGPRRQVLLAALGEQGFVFREGWRVTWPGGGPLEDKNLYRLALLAVWFRGMRSREQGDGG